MFLPHAYKAEGMKCKTCGKDHYYLTNNHIVIMGSEKELQDINFPFEIEVYDPEKSDIKDIQNIFGMWPELDTSREGILRYVGQAMPAMCYGYWIRNIEVTDDKNTITVKYSKQVEK